MKIDRRLNLVQPIETDTGMIYLHSTPLSREVWENYFLVLSKTYAAILSEGLTVIGGPPVARMLLKRIAQNSGIWEGEAGVERGLLAEIRRLTNVVMPTASGWQTVPYEQVLGQGSIDEDDLAVAEGAIVFFICVSAVQRGRQNREKLMILLNGVRAAWGAQNTSLDATGFAASLPTSTPDENSGAKKPASSVPH